MESARNLKYFLAVADAGSVTGAAQALGIAQPALSQAITRMERELGVKLFERTRRGAALTTAGAAIVDDIRLGVSRIDAAEKRARDIGAQLGGRLTVGFASAALFDVLPRAIAALRAQAPGVELVLKEMSNAEQAAALEEGSIDLGLLHTPVAVGGKMREKLIVRERMLAVMPLAHPVSDDGKVSLRELADLGLVWFPHDETSSGTSQSGPPFPCSSIYGCPKPMSGERPRARRALLHRSRSESVLMHAAGRVDCEATG